MVEQEQGLHFAHTALLQLFLDYDDVTNIRRVNVYFPPPFLAWFFEQLHTRSVSTFMCDTVLRNPGCTSQLGGPPVDTCVDDLLNDFPLTTAGGYVDGSSFGCKLLHASFARTNFHHCAHVSLDPVDLDPSGVPVCSVSLELPEGRFFSADDTTGLEEFGWTRAGIDPSMGYTILNSIDDVLEIPSA